MRWKPFARQRVPASRLMGAIAPLLLYPPSTFAQSIADPIRNDDPPSQGGIQTEPSSSGLATVLPRLEIQGELGVEDAVIREDGTRYDTVSFQGQAGYRVSITLESLEFDPVLRLQDSQGQVIGQNDDYHPTTTNSALILVLPQDGTYTVVVTGYQPWSQGSYQLTVVPIPSEQSEVVWSATALQQLEAGRWHQQGLQDLKAQDFHAALQSLQQALSIRQIIGDRHWEAITLNDIGAVYNELEQYPQALDMFQQALALHRDLSNRTGESTTLNNMGVAYHAMDQYSQASNLFSEALTLAQDSGDLANQAMAVSGLLMGYSHQAQFQQVLDLYPQALALVQETGNQSLEGQILLRVGSAYSSLGQYAQALEVYQHALSVVREIPDRPLEVAALNNLGVAYTQLGQHPQALERFQQALSLARESGDRDGETASLLGMANIAKGYGHYSQALEGFQQALEIAQSRGDRQTEGIALGSIGNVYDDLAQYDQALSVYEQALAIHQALGDRENQRTGLNNLAGVYESLGQYAQALTRYQEALSLTRDLGDRAAEGTILNNMGVLYRSLGQGIQALELHQHALAIARDLGDRPGESVALTNLGTLYDEQGQSQLALQTLQQALTIHRELNHPQNESSTLNNIGAIYSDLESYPQALASYHDALAIHRRIGDRHSEAITLSNIGSLYFHQRDYAQALAYAQQAWTIQREIGDREGESTTLSNLGFLLESQGHVELAIVFYKQSVNITESIRQDLHDLSPEQQQSYTETITDGYRQLANLLLQQDRVLEAQEVLDLLKLQELEDYLREVRGNAQTAQGLDFWPIEQQILNQYRQATATGQSFVEFLADPTVIAQVEQLRRTARGQNLNPDQLVQLQDNLRTLHNAALLYPLVLDDRLELVLVTPAALIRRTVPVERDALNRAIAQFRGVLVSPSTRDATPQAQQLYQWLIQPIELELEQAGIQTILYAADGSLRYIPLAALYDGQQWLIQRFTINHITAASLTNFTPSEARPTLRVLAGAFSDTNQIYQWQRGDQQFQFGGLPFAGIEVDQIAANIPTTTRLVNQAFSRAAVESRMANYTIIHLATHADFVPGSPEESFILFGNGDRITLREIDNWSLPTVDLVVLSACETAVSGNLGNGEEILGFGYQVQQTGAKAAIASLWRVNDIGGQALMTAFYAALTQGMSEAQALRQAQIALITGDYTGLNLDSEASSQPNQRLDRPYYWAPFILIGNGL